MQITKSRWLTPVTTAVLGVGMLVAFVLGGRTTDGIIVFGVSLGLATLFAMNAGGETLRGLAGAERDERFWQMDIFATAVAGIAVITAALIGFAVAVARGHSGAPYDWLAAVGGIAYILGVVLYKQRR
jgi:hypothetical protein